MASSISDGGVSGTERDPRRRLPVIIGGAIGVAGRIVVVVGRLERQGRAGGNRPHGYVR